MQNNSNINYKSLVFGKQIKPSNRSLNHEQVLDLEAVNINNRLQSQINSFLSV